MRLETWYLTPGGWSCGTVAQDGDERFVEAPAERAAIVQVARLAEGEVAREPTVLFRDAAAAPQLEARFGQWPPGVAPASAPSRVARGAEDVNPSRAGGREAIALALRCWLLAPALALAAGALALPVAAALLAGTPRQLIPGSSSSGAFGYLFEIGQSFAAGFEGLIALLAGWQ